VELNLRPELKPESSLDMKAIPFIGFMIDSVASSKPHLSSSMRTMSHKISNSMIFSMRLQSCTQGGNPLIKLMNLMKMRRDHYLNMRNNHLNMKTNSMSLEDLETILKMMIRI